MPREQTKRTGIPPFSGVSYETYIVRRQESRQKLHRRWRRVERSELQKILISEFVYSNGKAAP